MSKVDDLIKSIDAYTSEIQKADLDIIQDFEGSDALPDAIENYEKNMAKVFREEKKRLKATLNASIRKTDEEIPFDELTFEQMLQYYENDLFVSDQFKEEIKDVNAKYFREIVDHIAESMMESIDSDIPYTEPYQPTLDFIDTWSEELSEIMQLNTHEKIETVLTEAIKEGKSVQNVELELEELNEFSRQRARTTAMTEIVSASNAGLQEAYTQSPSVKGKRWRHSGTKNRKNPRRNHMMMDGLIVNVDEEFTIHGSGETCMHPGDPKLSAKERVHCGCISSPVVDSNVLGLTAEEKEKIRQEAREELERS